MKKILITLAFLAISVPTFAQLTCTLQPIGNNTFAVQCTGHADENTKVCRFINMNTVVCDE